SKPPNTTGVSQAVPVRASKTVAVVPATPFGLSETKTWPSLLGADTSALDNPMYDPGAVASRLQALNTIRQAAAPANDLPAASRRIMRTLGGKKVAHARCHPSPKCPRGVTVDGAPAVPGGHGPRQVAVVRVERRLCLLAHHEDAVEDSLVSTNREREPSELVSFVRLVATRATDVRVGRIETAEERRVRAAETHCEQGRVGAAVEMKETRRISHRCRHDRRQIVQEQVR